MSSCPLYFFFQIRKIHLDWQIVDPRFRQDKTEIQESRNFNHSRASCKSFSELIWIAVSINVNYNFVDWLRLHWNAGLFAILFPHFWACLIVALWVAWKMGITIFCFWANINKFLSMKLGVGNWSSLLREFLIIGLFENASLGASPPDSFELPIFPVEILIVLVSCKVEISRN